MPIVQHIHRRILRRTQVEEKTGLARSTIYKRMAAGNFPKQINLGSARAVGWLESDIDNWIDKNINKEF